VPEQTWSSSAFLSATIHGMLGLESDGRTHVLHFAPRVPMSWHSFSVEHVRVGENSVNLRWESENGHFVLDIRNSGPGFHFTWRQEGTGKDGTTFTSLERYIPTGDTRLHLP
jgi:cellobiose phosphorylase